MDAATQEQVKKLVDTSTEVIGAARAAAERAEKAGLKIEELGDLKATLATLTDKVADAEATIDRLKRSGVDPVVANEDLRERLLKGRGKGFESFFEDPRDEAHYLLTSTDEYKRAFATALRRQCDPAAIPKQAMAVLSFADVPKALDKHIKPETKAALSTDFMPGAGFFAPATMESEITGRVLEYSSLGAYARNITIGTGSYAGLLRNDAGETIAAIGERQTRTGTSTLKDRYRKRTIEVHESYAHPAVTQTMLDDSTIDIAGELLSDMQLDFAVDEATKLWTGAGDNEAEGLMTNDEVGYYASGEATTFGMDVVRLLPTQIKGPFRVGSMYMVSRDALRKLMIFRENTGAGDGTGAYMWQPSLLDGTPSRLNGYPWAEATELDDVEAGSFPIVFGNFKEAYRVIRRRGITIVRDNLTEKPFVIFFATRRFGGGVWRAEAVKKLKIATS